MPAPVRAATFQAITLVLLCQACASMTAPLLSKQILPVSEQVTLAGRIEPGAVSRLAKQNVQIVDLRGVDEEHRSADEQRLRRAGVRYHNIPMEGAQVSEPQVQALAQLLEQEPTAPIVLHCASGNRAALLWAAWRVTQGTEPEAAIDNVSAIINSDAIEPAIRAYAAKSTTR